MSEKGIVARDEELKRSVERLQARDEELKRSVERLQARDEELKRLVERLEALIDEAPIAVVNVDVKGKITYVNKDMLQRTGYLREELVGKNGFRLGLFSRETLKLLGERMKEKLMGKPPSPLEMQFKRKDGEWMWVETRGRALWEHGVPVGIQIVAQDITERKRMEGELRRLDEFSRTVLNSINDAVSLIDVSDFKIVGVNNTFLKQLGLKEEEVIGKTCCEITHHRSTPYSSPDDTCPLTATVASGEHAVTEHVHYGADGEKIYVEVSTSPVKDRNGKVMQVVHVSRDITERKEMEEKLKESEERYRNLVQNALDIIYTVTPDGTVTSLNPAFETITGWSCSEWIGKQFASMVHPDDLPLATELFQNAIQRGTAGALEARILTKSGEYLHVEVKSTPLTQNERVVGFLGIARDITERRRMEEALRESEERYRTLFESKLDGVVVIDETMKPLLANQAAAEIFGFDSAEELLEVNPFDFIPSEERERVLTILTKDMFENNLRQVNEFRLINKVGEEVWISAVGALIEYQGKVVGLASFRDVTQRKRLREQLVHSERLAAIGQLAGGVGHELRNPLGAIKNAVYYIKGKVEKSELGQKEPRVMEFLDIMDDEINSSAKIINDLLGFSRVDKPSVAPTRIEGVIEDALSYMSVPENIELVKRLDADLPDVEIDAGQVQQVLVNIIMNAVQAMPEGGKLTIGARQRDKFLEVEISDTGCGISQEAISKIFDPLFTTKAKGIGLGLAVCKAIIERHEGSIEVKSEVGKGATLTIRLPLKAK